MRGGSGLKTLTVFPEKIEILKSRHLLIGNEEEWNSSIRNLHSLIDAHEIIHLNVIGFLNKWEELPRSIR